MTKRIDFAVWIVAAGAIAVAVGSALSWVDAHWARGTIHIHGLSGDGKVTVLCAAAAMVAIATTTARRMTSVVLPTLGLLAGAMMTATAWYDTVHLRHTVAASGRLSDGIITTYVGSGLWVVDAASIVAVIGAALAIRECRLRRSDLGLEIRLPRLECDMVVSRTVVLTLPEQREASDLPAEKAES